MIRGWGNMEVNWSLMHQSFKTSPAPSPPPAPPAWRGKSARWGECYAFTSSPNRSGDE